MVLSLKYFLNIYALYERGLLKRKIYSRWIQQIYIDAKLTLKIHSYELYHLRCCAITYISFCIIIDLINAFLKIYDIASIKRNLATVIFFGFL